MCESIGTCLAQRVLRTFAFLGVTNFIEKYILKRQKQRGKSCFQDWLSDGFALNGNVNGKLF